MKVIGHSGSILEGMSFLSMLAGVLFHVGLGYGSTGVFLEQSGNLDAARFITIEADARLNVAEPLGGDLSLGVGPQFLFLTTSDVGGTGGFMNALVRYEYEGFYGMLCAGVGAIDTDWSHQEDGLNFLLQGGVGYRHKHTHLNVRFHHISNAGTHGSNVGPNALLIGIGHDFTF